jgi:predicted MFS family arabinose efflux permease
VSTAPTVPRAVTRVAWRSCRLALGTATALGLARFAYGLLLPAMRDDLHWTLAEAGAMSTANGLGYLLGALATPMAVRRWGAHGAFRAGMALVAGSLAATAVSNNYLALLAARTLAGAVGAVVFIAGAAIASRIAADAASATPITVYFAGTGLGIALSGLSIPALGDHWRLTWLLLAGAAALAAAVSWSAAGGPDDQQHGTGRARLRTLWPSALAYLLFAAGYITYITYLSAYLADQHASLLQVMLTWTVLGLAVMAAPALWSSPIANWPGSRALAVLLAVLGSAAALALVSPEPPVVLVSALMYGATFMGVPAAVTALIKARTSPGDRTPTLAVFTTVFAAGQTVGPWLAGVLADRTSTEATLAWTAILCLAASAVAAAGGRTPTHPRRGTARPGTAPKTSV